MRNVAAMFSQSTNIHENNVINTAMRGMYRTFCLSEGKREPEGNLHRRRYGYLYEKALDINIYFYCSLWNKMEIISMAVADRNVFVLSPAQSLVVFGTCWEMTQIQI